MLLQIAIQQWVFEIIMEQNKRPRLQIETIDNLACKPGLRGKIDAKCCECIYDPYQEGTWRKQVENCTSMACPLFPIRAKTIQKKKGG